ncbi:MAG: HAD family hydrolase [Dethiobacteria bacterium]|nr:HAD family hydrolase [Bacillota bacterium]
MIKGKYDAILLDLDGTLLDIDLDQFIPAYVKSLAGRFSDYIEPHTFSAHLFGSTITMVNNSDAAKNNREVFYEDFCRRIGYSYENIKPVIDDFYRNDFPKLSCWGRKVPHSEAVIEAVLAQKVPLVLATNPIFPPEAVYQRIKWAGLSADQFSLVTTMDNMHFCKPNPEYYLEIANKINCPPDNCLMAGNDTLEDLIAAEVGMETFLVDDYILHRKGHDPDYNYRGSLEDLANFLKEE